MMTSLNLLGPLDWHLGRFRHILPNCLGPLLVQGTFIFAYAVLAKVSRRGRMV